MNEKLTYPLLFCKTLLAHGKGFIIVGQFIFFVQKVVTEKDIFCIKKKMYGKTVHLRFFDLSIDCYPTQ